MDKIERALIHRLALAGNTSPSTEEVVFFLASIIKAVKEAISALKEDIKSTENDDSVSELQKSLNELENSLVDMIREVSKSTLDESNTYTDKEINKLGNKVISLVSKSSKESQNKAYKQLNSALLGIEQQIRSIDKYDDSAIQAKWAIVVGDIYENIDKVKLLIPTAITIRDLLESLNNDDRLDISAIKGFDKLSKSLQEDILMRATSILDSRTSFLINKVSALQTQVNSIPTTSSSGFQQPLTGALNQGTFTWTTAPNVIVVDEVPRQKVQSDGTVNWTGTTTTVLTQWPSSDIFSTC